MGSMPDAELTKDGQAEVTNRSDPAGHETDANALTTQTNTPNETPRSGQASASHSPEGVAAPQHSKGRNEGGAGAKLLESEMHREDEDLEVDVEVRSILDHAQADESDTGDQHSTYSMPSYTAEDGGVHVSDRRKVEGSQLPPKKAASPPRTPSQSRGKTSRGHIETTKGHTEEIDSPTTARATNLTVNLSRNVLPPEPEPEIRFNFHLFLEQLRHRTADPVARYLRSFLVEFGKKQWTVQEQVRIITDFLTFIGGKMAQCEIWREASEAEFDNAREGMEKLVMNRLYGQTFSPEIPLSTSSVDRGRKRTAKQQVPGRRGQHLEDVERDHVLSEKMQIFGWVEEQHLDIRPVTTDGKRFLSIAQQELCKINNYRAPRDKVICILNACKVIFGLLRSSKETDTSADAFMPLLIYTVLRAKPQHMVSNIQYIFRFRNQDKLGGEAGYYLSSLMGAVQFVETLDRTALSISDQEFERHVEESVAAIAERRVESELQPPKDTTSAALLSAEATIKSTSRSPSRLLLGDSESPVSGIIRNIQRPLSNLGRMFSDENSDSSPIEGTHRVVPDPSRERATRSQNYSDPSTAQQAEREGASRRIQADGDVNSIIETLSSMFPALDRDVISDIVIAKDAK